MRAPIHKFTVGERVQFADGFSAQRGSKAVAILALLPPLGSVAQYRVRNENETYDRVVTESTLFETASVPVAQPRHA